MTNVRGSVSSTACVSSSKIQNSAQPRVTSTLTFLHILEELSVINPKKIMGGTILSCLSTLDLSAFAYTCRQMALYSRNHRLGRMRSQFIDRAIRTLPIINIIDKVKTCIAPEMKEGSVYRVYIDNQCVIIQKISTTTLNIFVYLAGHMNDVQGGWKSVELCLDVFRRQVAVIGMEREKSLKVVIDLQSLCCLRDCTNILVPYAFIDCYDVISKKTNFAMISKWCNGGDLRSIFNSPSPIFSLTDNIRKIFIYDIAQALVALHTKGMCHGDLKLENIVVSIYEDTPRLMIIDLDSVRPNGSVYVTVGSPGYRAPERLQRETKVHTSADIFAFAIILYEIWTGTSPLYFWLQKDSYIEKTIEKFEPTREKMSTFFPEIKPDHALFCLMQSMLHRDPLKRPPIQNVLKQIHDIFSSPYSRLNLHAFET